MKVITHTEWFDLTNKERENFTGIVNWSTGTVTFMKNGLLHREDGPARILPDGYQEWYFEGKLHNLNGPAAIWNDGRKYYFINNKQTTKEAVNLLKDMLELKKIERV
jgi:hypothetical protein